jgi:tetratricopeptide (TPR) repeat protein
MDPRLYDIPAPSDDTLLMDLCAEIYRREWKTDTVQVNGRRGQGQAGVDVQGRPHDGLDWCGIQCKARSRQGTRKPKLSEREIRVEVELALGFRPALKHLIIATSAPHDAEAQIVARQITKDHMAKGLFSVDVLGWSEIRRRMDRYPEVHDWYRSLGPMEHRLERKLDAMDESISAKIKAAVATGNPSVIEDLIDAQIDIARSLVEKHRPHAAIQMLQAILELVDETLSSHLRFRILSNLGNARILLFDWREGGQLFLEAAKYAPDKDTAVAQHAWAHLILGELDAAERTARAAAKRFPRSGRPRAILLAIADQRGELEDPDAAVPTEFRADPNVAFTVAHIYAMRDDASRAAQWIKIGRANDPDSWQQRKAHAELLLQHAVGSNLYLLGSSSERRADLEVAGSELESIWELVRGGEPIEASAAIAAQVAMARSLAGDLEGARQACDAGLAMGDPPPPLIRVAAKLAEDEHRFEDVVALLSNADTNHFPERDMMISSAQMQLGQLEKAVRTLMVLAEDNAADPALRAAARARSIEIRANLEGNQELLAEALTLVEANPEVVVYRVVAAAIHEKLEQHDSALMQATAARDLLGEEANLNDQVMVAELLFDLGEPDDAAAIYARLAPDPVDSVLGRQLLRALFKADSRAALRERLDAMPASEKTDSFYLWIEAALLERIGKLSEATDLLTAYLKQHPTAAGPRLNWIAFLERLDQTDELYAYLDKNAELVKGTPIQQLRYAHVLARHDRTAEALRLGYETTRRAMRDPEVHLAYMGLVLSAHAFEPFENNTVEPDQGFIFKPNDGDTQRIFVIQPGEILDQADELPPDHPISRGAMGKCAGDALEIQAGPYSNTPGRIVAVRHKYLMLNDDVMENFNQRFPDHPGMFKVPVRGLKVSLR